MALGCAALACAGIVVGDIDPIGPERAAEAVSVRSDVFVAPLAFVGTLAELAARGELGAADVISLLPPGFDTSALDPDVVSRDALLAAISEAIEALPAEMRPTLLSDAPPVPWSDSERPVERVPGWRAELPVEMGATLAILVSYLDVDGRVMRRVRFFDVEEPRVRHVEWRELMPMEGLPEGDADPLPTIDAPDDARTGSGTSANTVDIAVRQCVSVEIGPVCDLSIALDAVTAAAPLVLASIRFVGEDGATHDARVDRIGGPRDAQAPFEIASGALTLISAWPAHGALGSVWIESLEIELATGDDRVVRRVPAPPPSLLR